ncbi:Origin recognition complex subunit 1 [Trichinella pseudospiralis]|uniref:Origin recognition complex subunit 1 n=1 Tax=Trichinella pseudospiralis TaxID=6337 RepID=A0A0V1E5A1_TRIPS|nr:Origin recognition complex subunit 1 [Trichinella pseudospiralis]KRY69031.1 Origin recognition complex subunit 1 [Trichinella pseudospiralis]
MKLRSSRKISKYSNSRSQVEEKNSDLCSATSDDSLPVLRRKNPTRKLIVEISSDEEIGNNACEPSSLNVKMQSASFSKRSLRIGKNIDSSAGCYEFKDEASCSDFESYSDFVKRKNLKKKEDNDKFPSYRRSIRIRAGHSDLEKCTTSHHANLHHNGKLENCKKIRSRKQIKEEEDDDNDDFEDEGDDDDSVDHADSGKMMRLRRQSSRKSAPRASLNRRSTAQYCTISDSDLETLEGESDLVCRTKRVRKLNKNNKDHNKKSQTVEDHTPSYSCLKKGFQGRCDNAFDELKARLHTSVVPVNLPCREKQCLEIENFVKCCLKSGNNGCLYISGVPGTGKTVAVRQAIRSLQNDNKLPAFVYCEINGMQLADPKNIYFKMACSVFGSSWKSKSADKTQKMLNNFFNDSNPDKPHLIALLDEVDYMIAGKQRTLYQVFDWSTLENSKLVLLTVANTLDFPERILCKRITSRLGLTRLCFPSYSHAEIQKIIEVRLSDSSAVGADAVQLVSRKVASVSGDIRRALEICRLAADIASSEYENEKAEVKRNDGGQNRKQQHEQKQQQLTLEHIGLALKEMASNLKFAFIKNTSLQQQLVLRALVCLYNQTACDEVSFRMINMQYKKICHDEDKDPVGIRELVRILHIFVSVGILVLGKQQLGYLDSSFRFAMNAEDISASLQ